MRYGILRTVRKSLLLKRISKYYQGEIKMSIEKELEELEVPVYEQDNLLNQFYWDELETEELDLTDYEK